MNFKITTATSADLEKINDQLDEFNEAAVPILQEEANKRFAYIIKHATGKIIAGVEAYSSMYFIGYIDTLWVDQEYRHQGLGSQLMNKVEADLQRYGCPQCHLETFDYQAPGFIRKEDIGSLLP
ncbi:GNAT family N-acetyltransferase [Lactobacillus xylocopicola]|uniref:N-acetyltransferase domain-containing protein n=1 Tax=Lactobacillus xylocopicola TaxID=2976676 RepID=A0ABM8BHJ1_9LACO|nr:GNAT family N-acetyltransferase [Lactobacillus xylocopicola]BDR60765.1 hypothetical protein KIM322_10260 [Lactobacillus xylocopicola]